MDATITTIGDIFKKKVDTVISDSYKAPTIWVDSRTGEEHEDYEYSCVKSADPDDNPHYWKGKPKDPSYVEYENNRRLECLVVNGPIKQVGSHVVKCGKIHINDKKYPFADRIDQLFKYARNLEVLDSTFDNIRTWPDRLILPENLFWNCPKLKVLNNCFCRALVTEIPPKLLSKCPALEDVHWLFYDASGVEEIPEDLFKDNPKIKDFNAVFQYTLVKKIPQDLFIQFKDNIEKGNINVDSFVANTPLAAEFMGNVKIPKTSAEKKAKRDIFFPNYLSKEIQWKMLGNISKKGYNSF